MMYALANLLIAIGLVFVIRYYFKEFISLQASTIEELNKKIEHMAIIIISLIVLSFVSLCVILRLMK